MIVIDEFASLARDLPDFVAGLVGQIRRVAEMLRIPVQHSPWLAPLPCTLPLRDLPGLGRQPEPGHAPFPFGLIDLPGVQRQQPAAISLESFGHLMAAGAPRSGRSQLLSRLGTELSRRQDLLAEGA